MNLPIEFIEFQYQSGQEKYTTEVVLPRFKSQLVLLDSRNPGGGGYQGGSDYGAADNSMGGGMDTGGGGAPMGPSGDDLDDDIPF